MNQEILITRETEQLVVEGQPSEFVHSEQSVEVFEALSQGPPGPPGPQGPPGPPSTASLYAVAGEALGGHRAIVMGPGGSLFYADCTRPEHFGRVAGVTRGAAAAGDTANCARSGLVTEPSWTWVANAPIYLGPAGLLTQTPPATGFQQVLGVALSATDAFLNPREPVFTLN